MNSNLILRILKSLAAALLICLASFFVLLVLAFSIPASLLRGNAASSAETLLAEGDNRYIFGGRQDWSLDNYTASIMLNTAAADVKNPVIALAEDYSWNKKGTTARVEHFADSIGRKVEEQRGGSGSAIGDTGTATSPLFVRCSWLRTSMGSGRSSCWRFRPCSSSRPGYSRGCPTRWWGFCMA